jgi:hypothetical protein
MDRSGASSLLALPSRIPLYSYMSVTREFVTGRVWCSSETSSPNNQPVGALFLVFQSERIVAGEPMPFDPGDVRKVAVALALGGIAGAAIIQSHHDEKQRSQAEKDDPQGVEWICELVVGSS